MPTISHLLLFGLSPENFENVGKMFINSITDFVSLRKKVVSSAYAFYRNAISKTSINKYAEIGPPCLVPF